jgi:hypothetical protein
MNLDTFDQQTNAVAMAFANADDWVCRAIRESGIEVPAEFADMFAARADSSKYKRVDLKNSAELALHMEILEKARAWFLTNVPTSALPSLL